MVETTSTKLPNLFPEEPSLDKKAWKFLELYYNSRCSLYSVSKKLKINYRTARNILNDIKDSTVYDDFIALTKQDILQFSDPKFQETIYKRYEDQLEDIEQRIKELEEGVEVDGVKIVSGKSIMELLKLRASVLRDQLKAALLLHKEDTTTPEDRREQEALDRLKEAAFREFPN